MKPAYKLTNEQNLGALLGHMTKQWADSGGTTIRKGYNEIEYLQARGYVLLGRGHTDTDIQAVDTNSHSEGKVYLYPQYKKGSTTLRIDKIEIAGTMVQGDKKTKQTSNRFELQQAVKEAMDATRIEWKENFVWLDG